jgi:hypothetical protein
MAYLSAVPADESSSDFEVFAFESKTLKIWFSKALKALEKAERAPDLDVPIFLPLDDRSKKMSATTS